MIPYWIVLFEWMTVHGHVAAVAHMFNSHEGATKQANDFETFCKRNKSKVRTTISGPFYRDGV